MHLACQDCFDIIYLMNRALTQNISRLDQLIPDTIRMQTRSSLATVDLYLSSHGTLARISAIPNRCYCNKHNNNGGSHAHSRCPSVHLSCGSSSDRVRSIAVCSNSHGLVPTFPLGGQGLYGVCRAFTISVFADEAKQDGAPLNNTFAHECLDHLSCSIFAENTKWQYCQ